MLLHPGCIFLGYTVEWVVLAMYLLAPSWTMNVGYWLVVGINPYVAELTYITYHKEHSNSKSQGFFPPFRDLHAILFSAASGLTTSFRAETFPARKKGRKPKRVLTGRRCSLPRLEKIFMIFDKRKLSCLSAEGVFFSNESCDVFGGGFLW